MMVRVQDCKRNVILLGDFNIDMKKKERKKKKKKAWDSTIFLCGLDQLVTLITRITPYSLSLIDHIYASDTKLLSNMHVPVMGISDHF